MSISQQSRKCSVKSDNPEVHELNARNASLSRLSSGEYIEDHYIQEGWFQDEHGEWCYDPALAFADAQPSGSKKVKTSTKRSESIKSSSSQSADKNKNAPMPSSNAMSDNIYDYDQSAGAVADNYDEGWYQDEYGNWLNQFDWKQV